MLQIGLPSYRGESCPVNSHHFKCKFRILTLLLWSMWRMLIFTFQLIPGFIHCFVLQGITWGWGCLVNVLNTPHSARWQLSCYHLWVCSLYARCSNAAPDIADSAPSRPGHSCPQKEWRHCSSVKGKVVTLKQCLRLLGPDGFLCGGHPLRVPASIPRGPDWVWILADMATSRRMLL